MDIKGKIDEIVGKIKSDPNLGESFKKDPIKTIEGILGVDLPDETVQKIVAGVKGALTSGAIGDKISDAVEGIKKMF